MDPRIARRRLDERLQNWSQVARTPVPHRGWIRAIRDALGMSSTELAARMNVDQSRIPRMENAEVRGAIQLQTLERAAAAMGCRLVYALVPQTTLEDAVHKRAREKALEQLDPVTHTMGLEEQRAGTRADEELLDDLTADWIDRRGLWS